MAAQLEPELPGDARLVTYDERIAAGMSPDAALRSALRAVERQHEPPIVPPSLAAAAERTRQLGTTGPVDPERSARFIEEQVETRTNEIRQHSGTGDFALASAAAQHLAATLDHHARARTWELGRGIDE